MPYTSKTYIPLSVFWDNEGGRNYNDEVVPDLTPTCLYLEGGGVYEVERIRLDGMMPGRKCGGYGVRYTARTSCEDEENYNKVFYLYFERFGTVGRWRCGDEYVAADVVWDAGGKITPTCIYLAGHPYTIRERDILQQYPMSARKSDGSGKRYIVRASCRELRDYNRELSLMLENGGEFVGRWFCEDADIVENRKVLYTETGFNTQMIQRGVCESMGATDVCARYQVTIEISDFLRDWNRKHGIWLSPEDFEKKIKKGDICPTDYAPVFVAGGERGIETKAMKWGLKRSWTKTPLYNAKVETVTQKETFQGIVQNRCVVPSGGFYEWERENGKAVQKYVFRMPDAPKLYMAGLYEPVEDGYRYTILTTDANDSVDIHDRMPVVLRYPGECKAWLKGRIGPEDVCNRRGIKLTKAAV